MTHLTAHDCSNALDSGTPVSFGVDHKKTAQKLHKLADEIGAVDSTLISIEVASKAKGDDFVITTVTVAYCEKVR